MIGEIRVNHAVQLSFFDPHTYAEDISLFEKLGIPPFFMLLNEERFLGKVDFEDGSFVKIKVCAALAFIWDVKVYCKKTEGTYTLRWGGLLVDKWSTIEALMKGEDRFGEEENQMDQNFQH